MSLADDYDLIVFDLDGTLADTAPDIRTSLNRALAAAGREELPMELVLAYVGEGARRLVERALGPESSEDAVEEVLERFLTDYVRNCLRETRLYPGVRTALAALQGRPLAVLTNKPRTPAVRILKGLEILPYFTEVVGGDTAREKKPAPGGLLDLASKLRVSPQKTLLVGDTAVDVETARAAGAAVAGVRYGFRPEDFAREPPDYFLDSLEDLL